MCLCVVVSNRWGKQNTEYRFFIPKKKHFLRFFFSSVASQGQRRRQRHMDWLVHVWQTMDVGALRLHSLGLLVGMTASHIHLWSQAENRNAYHRWRSARQHWPKILLPGRIFPFVLFAGGLCETYIVGWYFDQRRVVSALPGALFWTICILSLLHTQAYVLWSFFLFRHDIIKSWTWLLAFSVAIFFCGTAAHAAIGHSLFEYDDDTMSDFNLWFVIVCMVIYTSITGIALLFPSFLFWVWEEVLCASQDKTNTQTSTDPNRTCDIDQVDDAVDC